MSSLFKIGDPVFSLIFYERDKALAKLQLIEEIFFEADVVFSTWYNISEGDLGNLEISDDDGSTWDLLDSFTGESEGWTTKSADITSWIGGDIIIRFRFMSNDLIESEGWYVDDVKIIAKQYSELFGKLVIAKPKYVFNPVMKRMVMVGNSSGFPDFIAFKLIAVKVQGCDRLRYDRTEVIGVEQCVEVILDRDYKQKGYSSDESQCSF